MITAKSILIEPRAIKPASTNQSLYPKYLSFQKLFHGTKPSKATNSIEDIFVRINMFPHNLNQS